MTLVDLSAPIAPGAADVPEPWGTESERVDPDRPLNLQAREALSATRTGIFWASHRAGLAYSQIERLVNLDQLPAAQAPGDGSPGAVP